MHDTLNIKMPALARLMARRNTAFRRPEEFATKMQERKYHYLLDAAWLRDEDCNEGSDTIMQSTLDPAAYELVRPSMDFGA